MRLNDLHHRINYAFRLTLSKNNYVKYVVFDRLIPDSAPEHLPPPMQCTGVLLSTSVNPALIFC